MNTSDLHQVMDFLFKECTRLLDLKGREYACIEGDRLTNFKEVSKELGGVPEYACSTYLYKQMKSIFQIVQDLVDGKEMWQVEKDLAEPWPGRFVDAINYLILLAALLTERKENENGGSESTESIGAGSEKNPVDSEG